MPPFWRERWVQNRVSLGRRCWSSGQFHLELAFAGVRPLSEDVQDQLGGIEVLEFEDAFEIAALGGRQLVVEDDGVDGLLAAAVGELLGLARADEGAANRAFHALGPGPDDLRAGRHGQLAEFGEGILHVPIRAGFEVGADEEGAFAGLDRVFGDEGLHDGASIRTGLSTPARARGQGLFAPGRSGRRAREHGLADQMFSAMCGGVVTGASSSAPSGASSRARIR